MAHLEQYLADETATSALAARIAPSVKPGMIIFLHGELGAGKTSFARALIHALGFSGRVKSPTYTLVELYKVSNICLYHFDFYRFNDPEEWLEAGFRECFSDENICLVEWPEKAAGMLPKADLTVSLTYAGTYAGSGRHVHISSATQTGTRLLETMSS